MFLNIRRLVSLSVVSLALAGCDSGGSGDNDPTIGGNYSGTFTIDGTPYTMLVTIPDDTDAGSFSFSGNVATSGVAFPFTGTGSYDHPDVDLTLTLTVDGTTEQFDGTVSDDGDTLTLTDSDNISFILRR